MSVSFQAKDSAALSVQLKVQELSLTSEDNQNMTLSGADVVVVVREPVRKVVLAAKHAADGTITGVAAADISIVDSTALTAGGDAMAIKLTGVTALVAGDALVVKYIVQE